MGDHCFTDTETAGGFESEDEEEDNVKVFHKG